MILKSAFDRKLILKKNNPATFQQFGPYIDFNFSIDNFSYL